MGVFLTAIQGVGADLDDQTFQSHAVRLTASLERPNVSAENCVVTELSSSHATISISVNEAPGTHVTLRIEGFEELLDARIAEIKEAETTLQLPLNHEHIAFMRQRLASLTTEAA